MQKDYFPDNHDDAIKLAKGLRAALDQTNSAKEKGLN